MTDEQATSRLAAINRVGVQRAWSGDDANREAAQRALLRRAELNSAASYGKVPVET